MSHSFCKKIILDRCPSRFGPPSKWTPRSKSASEYGPGSPYPLANMDLWGSLFASGFGLPSRIWTPRVFCHCNVSYFEYCTESVLNRHKSHLIYFKNCTKILDHQISTSYPGYFLLWRKDPGRRWSRDLLKSSRFLINYLGFLYDNHTKSKLKIKLKIIQISNIY